MRHHLLAVIVTLPLMASSASAQFLPPPPGPGFGYVNRGFAFGFPGGRFGFAATSYSYGYGGFPPLLGGGYGYTSVIPIYPTTVIVAPSPVVAQPRPTAISEARRQPDPEPPPIDRNRFIVISPNDPPRKDLVKLPPKDGMPKVEGPVREVDLGVRPGPLPLEAALAIPRAEADRQIELGRTAFAAAQLGRALERFQRAVNVAPLEPSSYFLLAQTELALGKYDDAFAHLEAGLKRQPNWPSSRFRPRDLYGANGVLYDEHLRQLQATRAAMPNDARLTFLLAVQEWFQGNRVQANRLLDEAAKGLDDARIVAPFRES